MTRKFHPSSYSGTKEALEAQARAGDANPEAKQAEGMPLILKALIVAGVILSLPLFFADKDDLRAVFGRSQ
jgi:hypothetical protein